MKEKKNEKSKIIKETREEVIGNGIIKNEDNREMM